jgi:hypothetical protein
MENKICPIYFLYQDYIIMANSIPDFRTKYLNVHRGDNKQLRGYYTKERAPEYILKRCAAFEVKIQNNEEWYYILERLRFECERMDSSRYAIEHQRYQNWKHQQDLLKQLHSTNEIYKYDLITLICAYSPVLASQKTYSKGFIKPSRNFSDFFDRNYVWYYEGLKEVQTSMLLTIYEELSKKPTTGIKVIEPPAKDACIPKSKIFFYV